MLARLEELAADGARTTNVLMKLITHVPNLAKIIKGGGSGTLNLMGTASPDSEDPAVIVVAGELQAAAGKRDRDGADANPEETARLEEEEGTFELDVERLRKMKLVEKPKVWVAPLEREGEEQGMEVDSDEEDEGEAGVPRQLGIHGPMEMSGNTLCLGYGGYYFYNNS